jgi:hypothetical protein
VNLSENHPTGCKSSLRKAAMPALFIYLAAALAEIAGCFAFWA